MSDEKLESLSAEIRDQIAVLQQSIDQIRRALLGDLLPDGEEGLVQKVRQVDKARQVGTRLAIGALAIGIASWVKDLMGRL